MAGLGAFDAGGWPAWPARHFPAFAAVGRLGGGFVVGAPPPARSASSCSGGAAAAAASSRTTTYSTESAAGVPTLRRARWLGRGCGGAAAICGPALLCNAAPRSCGPPDAVAAASAEAVRQASGLAPLQLAARPVSAPPRTGGGTQSPGRLERSAGGPLSTRSSSSGFGANHAHRSARLSPAHTAGQGGPCARQRLACAGGQEAVAIAARDCEPARAVSPAAPSAPGARSAEAVAAGAAAAAAVLRQAADMAAVRAPPAAEERRRWWELDAPTVCAVASALTCGPERGAELLLAGTTISPAGAPGASAEQGEDVRAAGAGKDDASYLGSATLRAVSDALVGAAAGGAGSCSGATDGSSSGEAREGHAGVGPLAGLLGVGLEQLLAASGAQHEVPSCSGGGGSRAAVGGTCIRRGAGRAAARVGPAPAAWLLPEERAHAVWVAELAGRPLARRVLQLEREALALAGLR